MGAQQRVYKQRIRSAQGMKKIFKAKEMVAASRIAKAHARVEATTPYAEALTRAIGSVATHSTEISHPFLESERNETGRVGILMITADRGMTGPYSHNVIRAAVGNGKLDLLPLLFVGKISVRELGLLEELQDQGVLVDPPILPPSMSDVTALTSWMAFSNLLNRVDAEAIEDEIFGSDSRPV